MVWSHKILVFPFLTLEQHTTFSFCQSHRWSILNQSFASVVSGSRFAQKLINISPFWIYYLWKITIWVYIWLLGKNQLLIGYQISLIAIDRQPKYHRFYALVKIYDRVLPGIFFTLRYFWVFGVFGVSRSLGLTEISGIPKISGYPMIFIRPRSDHSLPM